MLGNSFELIERRVSWKTREFIVNIEQVLVSVLHSPQESSAVTTTRATDFISV